MTRATAPVAAEIIAGRPPRTAMDTAIVNEAKSPTRGSTPAMIEKEIASGIRARATTSPASTSVRSRRGERSAARTVGSGAGVTVVLTGVRSGEVERATGRAAGSGAGVGRTGGAAGDLAGARTP